jgi:hypothetical protein
LDNPTLNTDSLYVQFETGPMIRVTVLPEPTSLALLCLGIAGAFSYRQKLR